MNTAIEASADQQPPVEKPVVISEIKTETEDMMLTDKASEVKVHRSTEKNFINDLTPVTSAQQLCAPETPAQHEWIAQDAMVSEASFQPIPAVNSKTPEASADQQAVEKPVMIAEIKAETEDMMLTDKPSKAEVQQSTETNTTNDLTPVSVTTAQQLCVPETPVQQTTQDASENLVQPKPAVKSKTLEATTAARNEIERRSTPTDTSDTDPTTPMVPILRLGVDVIADLQTCLGSGSQANVYMAKLEPSGKPCVLKDFKFSDKQCQREVNMLHKMNFSSFFPQIYGTTKNRCIAMEYLGNQTVIEALESAPMTPIDWIDVALNVATGIQELHDAGFIHGDLKPENIMVHQNTQSNWQATIIDLGLAEPINPPPAPYKMTPEQISYFSKVCTHLAPEILDGTKGISVKGDVFSLGVVLYIIGEETGIVPLQNWAMHCLDPDPATRPNTNWLVSMLTKLQSKWATK